LLVDDEQEILQAVMTLVRDEFAIVGTTSDGDSAVKLATSLSPDVIVLDISMPKTNGIEVSLRLQELGCRSRIVFLTVHDDPDFIEAALSVGAAGYILKPDLTTDLIAAIWAVLGGYIFFSPQLGLA